MQGLHKMKYTSNSHLIERNNFSNYTELDCREHRKYDKIKEQNEHK